MDIVLILACFNFSNSRERQVALVKTLHHLNGCVDIVLVGWGLDWHNIPRSPNLKTIDIPSASIIWQKERFFNLALLHRREHHKYIVWADADILFIEQGWQDRLKAKLESDRLVQLFNRVEDVKLDFTLDPGHIASTGLIRQSVIETLSCDITPQDYFSQRGISLKIGCNPGLAWGAKIETIAKVGFPDFMILGSGDKVLLASAMGYHETFFQTLSLNARFARQYHAWGNRFFQEIKGRVSYLDNKIYHIIQGNYQNRRYRDRYQLIQDDRFAIDDYLTINEYGAWQWCDDGNEYAIAIAKYFQDRGD